MPSNQVNYFEIPVLDMARAKRFYEHVFQVELELMEVDGNEMAMFPYVEGGAGASGALAKGESYIPSKAGSRVYFSVEDIDSAVTEANRMGGELNYPITEVPGYGWVAEVLDTEGNCIAFHALERREPRAA